MKTIIDSEIRQKAELTYYPNGAIYIFNKLNFLSFGKIPDENVLPYIMSNVDSIDIDDNIDLEYVKLLMKKMNEFEIEGLKIGDNHAPVVIAEIGINHNGSIDEAKKIAKLAIDSGADIIKHQTHVVEDEMSFEAKSVIPGNADISIYEIMEDCALSEEDELELMNFFVKQEGGIFISTPFSRAQQ